MSICGRLPTSWTTQDAFFGPRHIHKYLQRGSYLILVIEAYTIKASTHILKVNRVGFHDEQAVYPVQQVRSGFDPKPSGLTRKPVTPVRTPAEIMRSLSSTFGEEKKIP